MDDLVASEPPSQVADMETWISAGLSTSCRVSVSGRNYTSGTTFISRPFRARDLVTMVGVSSTRLTSLERVTTGVGSVTWAARAKPNEITRSADQCDLRYVWNQFSWLLVENTAKLSLTSLEVNGTDYRSKRLKYNDDGKQNVTRILRLERGKISQKWKILTNRGKGVVSKPTRSQI